MIEHYYHLYADGDWRPALSEHQEALRGLPLGRVVVGVVGAPEARREALSVLPDWWDIVEADEGWEQVTLDALFKDLPRIKGPVLYAHSKGAANASDVNTAWRRCMTRSVVWHWPRALRALGRGHDTVGVHWLTPEEHPQAVQIPYYGGNFWWATADHLWRLPPPSHATRYHAEAWLGTVRPHNPLDLMPGWPGLGCAVHREPE